MYVFAVSAVSGNTSELIYSECADGVLETKKFTDYLGSVQNSDSVL